MTFLSTLQIYTRGDWPIKTKKKWEQLCTAIEERTAHLTTLISDANSDKKSQYEEEAKTFGILSRLLKIPTVDPSPTFCCYQTLLDGLLDLYPGEDDAMKSCLVTEMQHIFLVFYKQDKAASTVYLSTRKKTFQTTINPCFIVDLYADFFTQLLKDQRDLLEHYPFWNPHMSGADEFDALLITFRQRGVSPEALFQSDLLRTVMPSNEAYLDKLLDLYPSQEDAMKSSLVTEMRRIYLAFYNHDKAASTAYLSTRKTAFQTIDPCFIVDMSVAFFRELLGDQKDLLGLCPLFNMHMSDADQFAALLITLLQRGVSPVALIQSGLLHTFMASDVAYLDSPESVVMKVFAALAQQIKIPEASALISLCEETPWDPRFGTLSLAGLPVKRSSKAIPIVTPSIILSLDSTNFNKLHSHFGVLFLDLATRIVTLHPSLQAHFQRFDRFTEEALALIDMIVRRAPEGDVVDFRVSRQSTAQLRTLASLIADTKLTEHPAFLILLPFKPDLVKALTTEIVQSHFSTMAKMGRSSFDRIPYVMVFFELMLQVPQHSIRTLALQTMTTLISIGKDATMNDRALYSLKNILLGNTYLKQRLYQSAERVCQKNFEIIRTQTTQPLTIEIMQKLNKECMPGLLCMDLFQNLGLKIQNFLKDSISLKAHILASCIENGVVDSLDATVEILCPEQKEKKHKKSILIEFISMAPPGRQVEAMQRVQSELPPDWDIESTHILIQRLIETRGLEALVYLLNADPTLHLHASIDEIVDILDVDAIKTLNQEALSKVLLLLCQLSRILPQGNPGAITCTKILCICTIEGENRPTSATFSQALCMATDQNIVQCLLSHYKGFSEQSLAQILCGASNYAIIQEICIHHSPSSHILESALDTQIQRNAACWKTLLCLIIHTKRQDHSLIDSVLATARGSHAALNVYETIMDNYPSEAPETPAPESIHALLLTRLSLQPNSRISITAPPPAPPEHFIFKLHPKFMMLSLSFGALVGIIVALSSGVLPTALIAASISTVLAYGFFRITAAPKQPELPRSAISTNA